MDLPNGGNREGKAQYCSVCDGSKDYKDLAAHDSRFVTVYEHPEKVKELRKIITPCVDESFIP
jgi:hypothetical protein